MMRDFTLISRKGHRSIEIGRLFLVILALVLSPIVGYRTAIVENGSLLLVFGGLALFVIVLLCPEWGIWLIPISVALPRTLPRLFGQLGGMELSLALMLMAYLLQHALSRKRIQVDWFLGVMLLAAVPMALSALAGRGQEDSVRLYNWLGTCITYFLVLNLMTGIQSPYRILLGFTVIIVGMIFADMLFISGVPLPETDYEWHVYRLTAFTIGQANFIVSLATMLLPIPLAYAILTKKRTLRWLCVTLLVGNLALAVLVSTRAFILFATASTLAMSIPIWERYGVKPVRRAVVFLAGGLLAMWYMLPAGWTKLMERLVDTFLYGDCRIQIWIDQFEVGLRSPIVGYGAISLENSLLRFGIYGRHGLFPQIFFEYGLVFVVPVVVLLVGWVRRSLYLLRDPQLTVEQSAVALASWGIIVGLLANAITNVHLVLTAQYSVLAFSLAGLLAAQLKEVRESRPEAEMITTSGVASPS